jgi:hypothetical protein
MALPKSSGGSAELLFAGARHQMSAKMTPTLLKASSQKGAAIPSVPMMIPPSAGPIARLTLMPTLLAATADGKSGFGTSLATTDCRAGAVMAEPTVTTKLNSSKLTGVIRCSHTSAANAAETTVIVDSPTSKKRR